MAEKYYWLKLKRDFFKRHDIEIIESMPAGKDYVLFYLKLLCESIDHDGRLRFSETIPYSETMLATITRTDAETVKQAVKIFTELGMMDLMDDGTLYMTQIDNMIGCESEWAEKKRIWREQKKTELGHIEDNVPDNVLTLSDKSKSKSKSKSKREIYIDDEGFVPEKETDAEKIINAWNELGLSKVTKIVDGTDRYVQLRKRIKDYGVDAILSAIGNIKESDFLMGRTASRTGKAFNCTFDWFIGPNNFVKVLDGNYKNKPEVKPEARSSPKSKLAPAEQHDYNWNDLDTMLIKQQKERYGREDR